MPKLSKDGAPNVQDFGPAVDRGGDLDDITVNFVTIKESHSLAPLLRGLPGDSCHGQASANWRERRRDRWVRTPRSDDGSRRGRRRTRQRAR